MTTTPNFDSTPSRSERADLQRLAKACGVQSSYHSGLTGLTHASDEAITLALQALGHDLTGPAQAARALNDLLAIRATRRLEPVVIGWVGSRQTALLRLKSGRGKLNVQPGSPGRARIEILTQSGEQHAHTADLADGKPIKRRQPDGSAAWFVKVPLTPAGTTLPAGYHRLRITHSRESFEARLIIAPKISYQTPGRRLGLFCPTYAIRSAKNLGVGNLTDLRNIGQWAADHGAPVLGTLPLLACFLGDGPLHAASPYSPVSRLFFNELFLDPAEAPGMASCTAAQHRMSSAGFNRRAAALRADRKLVDYRKSYRLLRPVLDDLAESFFASGGAESPEFKAFLAENPRADSYAAFRAVCEQRAQVKGRAAWDRWPDRLQQGRLTTRDFDTSSKRTHLYSQFAMGQQLHTLAESLQTRGGGDVGGVGGGGLYLDLAVGSHPDGYDVWANPELFMRQTSVGSPPDPTYTAGQDWGFPPMHPERAREDGYTYFVDSLRAQMRIAGSLRLDHVMALHRLFVVPAGHAAADGVYVGYHEDELFAILSLESHRNKCRVFGENLGTVPKAIEQAMTRHRVGKMWIGQFSLGTNPKRAVGTIEGNCVASLNTHDMPPVVACLEGSDIPTRVALKVFDPAMASGETQGRKRVQRPVTRFLRTHRMMPPRGKTNPQAIGQGLNRYIASSEAELMMVNIEDLWGETHLQNVPGTSAQHPNWRPKLAKALDGIRRDTAVAEQIEELAMRRVSNPRAITKPRGKSKTSSKK